LTHEYDAVVWAVPATVIAPAGVGTETPLTVACELALRLTPSLTEVVTASVGPSVKPPSSRDVSPPRFTAVPVVAPAVSD
jgi:hypothetical protein